MSLLSRTASVLRLDPRAGHSAFSVLSLNKNNTFSSLVPFQATKLNSGYMQGNKTVLRSLQTCQVASAAPTKAAAEKQDEKDFSEIPGPTPLPFIGNTLQLFMHKDFDHYNFFKVWESLAKEFGSIVKLKVFGLPTTVLTANADDIETIYKSTMENPMRIGFECLRAIRQDTKDKYFNKNTGLLTEHGEEWRRLRSRVQGPMLRPRNVAMYLPAVDSATKEFMDRIDLLQAKTGHVPDDFLEEIYKWALECIGLVALNCRLGCLDPNVTSESRPMELIRLVNDAFDTMSKAELGFPLWQFVRTPTYNKLAKIHQAFLELAIEAMKETESKLKETKTERDLGNTLGIMETLLNTEGLTHSDVATMILDMLLAGIDTASHTVGFALYLLSRSPDVQRRLQRQIDDVVKQSESLTPEHITALDGIAHVIKETLRLYPLLVTGARILTQDVVLSGYRVPAGTLALGFNSKTSRMEKYFQRPDEFLPERWQRDRPYGDIHPYASLPFSHGTRVCIGKRFAEQEMHTLLIRILQKYTITFDPDKDMEVRTPLIQKPVTPLAFRFVPRQ